MNGQKNWRKRKVLVIEWPDQRTVFEKHKGRDFHIDSTCLPRKSIWLEVKVRNLLVIENLCSKNYWWYSSRCRWSSCTSYSTPLVRIYIGWRRCRIDCCVHSERGLWWSHWRTFCCGSGTVLPQGSKPLGWVLFDFKNDLQSLLVQRELQRQRQLEWLQVVLWLAWLLEVFQTIPVQDKKHLPQELKTKKTKFTFILIRFTSGWKNCQLTVCKTSEQFYFRSFSWLSVDFR